jgi:hypothetical protein
MEPDEWVECRVRGWSLFWDLGIGFGKSPFRYVVFCFLGVKWVGARALFANTEAWKEESRQSEEMQRPFMGGSGCLHHRRGAKGAKV